MEMLGFSRQGVHHSNVSHTDTIALLAYEWISPLMFAAVNEVELFPENCPNWLRTHMLPLDLTSDVEDEDDAASSVLSQGSHYTDPSFSGTVPDNESGTVQSLLKQSCIVTSSKTPDARLDSVRQCQ